jgi:hypothetical protein
MIPLAEQLGVTAIFFKIAHGSDPRNRFLLSKADYAELLKWVQSASRTCPIQTNLNELAGLCENTLSPEGIADGRPVRDFYLKNQIRCFVPLFFLTCDCQANAYPCDYLQADTRSWNKPFIILRDTFCLGNLLANPEQVLERLSKMFLRIHHLPREGNDECGCCTRFCQFNAELTERQTTASGDSLQRRESAASDSQPSSRVFF